MEENEPDGHDAPPPAASDKDKMQLELNLAKELLSLGEGIIPDIQLDMLQNVELPTDDLKQTTEKVIENIDTESLVTGSSSNVKSALDEKLKNDTVSSDNKGSNIKLDSIPSSNSKIGSMITEVFKKDVESLESFELNVNSSVESLNNENVVLTSSQKDIKQSTVEMDHSSLNIETSIIGSPKNDVESMDTHSSEINVASCIVESPQQNTLSSVVESHVIEINFSMAGTTTDENSIKQNTAPSVVESLGIEMDSSTLGSNDKNSIKEVEHSDAESSRMENIEINHQQNTATSVVESLGKEMDSSTLGSNDKNSIKEIEHSDVESSRMENIEMDHQQNTAPSVVESLGIEMDTSTLGSNDKDSIKDAEHSDAESSRMENIEMDHQQNTATSVVESLGKERDSSTPGSNDKDSIKDAESSRMENIEMDHPQNTVSSVVESLGKERDSSTPGSNDKDSIKDAESSRMENVEMDHPQNTVSSVIESLGQPMDSSIPGSNDKDSIKDAESSRMENVEMDHPQNTVSSIIESLGQPMDSSIPGSNDKDSVKDGESSKMEVDSDLKSEIETQIVTNSSDIVYSACLSKNSESTNNDVKSVCFKEEPKIKLETVNTEIKNALTAGDAAVSWNEEKIDIPLDLDFASLKEEKDEIVKSMKVESDEPEGKDASEGISLKSEPPKYFEEESLDGEDNCTDALGLLAETGGRERVDSDEDDHSPERESGDLSDSNQTDDDGDEDYMPKLFYEGDEDEFDENDSNEDLNDEHENNDPMDETIDSTYVEIENIDPSIAELPTLSIANVTSLAFTVESQNEETSVKEEDDDPFNEKYDIDDKMMNGHPDIEASYHDDKEHSTHELKQERIEESSEAMDVSDSNVEDSNIEIASSTSPEIDSNTNAEIDVSKISTAKEVAVKDATDSKENEVTAAKRKADDMASEDERARKKLDLKNSEDVNVGIIPNNDLILRIENDFLSTLGTTDIREVSESLSLSISQRVRLLTKEVDLAVAVIVNNLNTDMVELKKEESESLESPPVIVKTEVPKIDSDTIDISSNVDVPSLDITGLQANSSVSHEVDNYNSTIAEITINTEDRQAIKEETNVDSMATITSLPQPVKTEPAFVPKVDCSEIFNLDSDDEEMPYADDSPAQAMDTSQDKKSSKGQCSNPRCPRMSSKEMVVCPNFAVSLYRLRRIPERLHLLCSDCFREITIHTNKLCNLVRAGRSLYNQELYLKQDYIELSDSEEDEETNTGSKLRGPVLSPEECVVAERLVIELFRTCSHYNLVRQVALFEKDLRANLAELQGNSKKFLLHLDDLQKNTDILREKFYGAFRPKNQIEPELNIPWEPQNFVGRRSTRTRKPVNYSHDYETDSPPQYEEPVPVSIQQPPAQLLALSPTQLLALPSLQPLAQLPAISKLPVHPSTHNAPIYPLSQIQAQVSYSSEDFKATDSLPPEGRLNVPMARVDDAVYAVRQSIFGAWAPARVLEVFPKGTPLGNGQLAMFALVRVRFAGLEGLGSRGVKQVTGRQLAQSQPSPVRYTIGTRVIALFKDQLNQHKRDLYYSGVIAETPNINNKNRYLVFFDDGYAQYVPHAGALAVMEKSLNVWEDVHPDSRDFVRKYLQAYPNRPMVRLESGQVVKVEWNGRWWVACVQAVDASLALLRFSEQELVTAREEWIYRGSTRLAPLFLELRAADRRSQGRPRAPAPGKNTNIPYVEYTRPDDPVPVSPISAEIQETPEQQASRINRAVAKKSTVVMPRRDLLPAIASVYAPAPPLNLISDPTPTLPPQPDVRTKVVYYTPRVSVVPRKMVSHACTPSCLNNAAPALRDLRVYNPLTRPLLSGWERLILKQRTKRSIMYRTPCGRRLRSPAELHLFLRLSGSEMSVDLFDFDHLVHCLAEFMPTKCFVSKRDLSHGVEAVPVPCVNYYDHSLPEFTTYSTRRIPTRGVTLNLDEEFLCGCDCTDDCQNKATCQCWQLTLEGGRLTGAQVDRVGYTYKRLLDPVPTGIYECNSRCKCAATCLNRVVQHPLQLKLQVFKTQNRGWGIRALNDVPRGAFLCIYAGNLLTDAVANVDGIKEGDEYLAELDYIEVVERLKEGYESDVVDPQSSSEDEQPVENSEVTAPGLDSDEEFQPGCFVATPAKGNVSTRMRTRQLKKKKGATPENALETENALITMKIKDDTDPVLEQQLSDNMVIAEKKGERDDEFITISDDEEVIREPCRFAAPEDLNDDNYVPKYKSVRAMYGPDEACYIMDAKVQGNLGRYLNHSCSPNVFVQNVFVDTHDPRFPWVAFFTLNHVRAGTELTWNYNYDVGSVPGKALYCRCGADNCRGRLL